MIKNDAKVDLEISPKSFYEDQFIKESSIEQSAVYLPRENYFQLGNLLKVIDNFFELSFLEQTAYLKVLSQMLSTLTMAHLPVFIEKVYRISPNSGFVEEHFELFLLLLEGAPVIIEYFMNSRSESSKRSILFDSILSATSTKTQGGTGIFSGNLEEPFKLKVLEMISNMLKFQSKANNIRFINAFGQFSDMLNTFENDNKLLFVILNLLHDQADHKRTVFALRLIERINRNCSSDYIEGFVAMDILSLFESHNSEIRRTAYLCFMSTLPLFRPDFFQKKFAATIERIANHKDTEVRLIFLKSIKKILKKLELSFIVRKILPIFSEMLTDYKLYLREEALLNLGIVVIQLLNKMTFDTVNIPVFCEILSVYFNLHSKTEGLMVSSRLNIIKSNLDLLPLIVDGFEKLMWPRIQRFILALQEYDNQYIVESVKLGLARNLGEIAHLLGSEIVEKHLIFLIDSEFLTLGPKTSQLVKLKTIEQLASILQITSPATRRYFVDYYIALQDEAIKWRIRASICKQLEELVLLFEPLDIVSFIAPMFFIFCKDECAIVRKMSCSRFYVIMKSLRASNEPNIFIVSENMKAFATMNKFHLRLSYIALFENLYWNIPDEVDAEMKLLMEALAADPIIGVRIRISVFISESVKRNAQDDFLETMKQKIKARDGADTQTTNNSGSEQPVAKSKPTILIPEYFE
jgi:hypothetical protein